MGGAGCEREREARTTSGEHEGGGYPQVHDFRELFLSAPNNRPFAAFEASCGKQPRKLKITVNPPFLPHKFLVNFLDAIHSQARVYVASGF